MGLIDYKVLYESAKQDAQFWKDAFFALDNMTKELRDILARKIDYEEQTDQSEL